jgi:zinc transport system ATP-binding protein
MPVEMNSPVLEMRDVWLSLRRMPVLEAVDLQLAKGDFLAIIGPNGGGKSVLLNVILGLLTPDRGVVKVFGMSPKKARGQVAYVPQYPRFDPTFPIRVIDVVLMGRLRGSLLGGSFSQEDCQRAHAALAEMGLADAADKQIGRLSGGQLQRVLIARALAVDARFLILDEPTASLDPQIAGNLYERLKERSNEMTVIVVSHDIGVISHHVKTVACMNRRFHYHQSKEITEEMVEAAYGCPVDFMVHRHTHRILEDHHEDGGCRAGLHEAEAGEAGGEQTKPDPEGESH